MANFFKRKKSSKKDANPTKTDTQVKDDHTENIQKNHNADLKNAEEAETIMFKRNKIESDETAKEYMQRQLTSNTQEFISKKIGQKIPIMGAALTAKEVVDKMKKGDYQGAVLAGVSGAVAQFPVVGTAGSIAIDMYVAKNDKNKEILKTSEIQEMRKRNEEVERMGFFKIIDIQAINELMQIARAQTAEAIKERNEKELKEKELINQGFFSGIAESVRNTKSMSRGETSEKSIAAYQSRKVKMGALRTSVQKDIKEKNITFGNISKKVNEEMSKMRGKGDFSEEGFRGDPRLTEENKAMGPRSTHTLTEAEIEKLHKV